MLKCGDCNFPVLKKQSWIATKHFPEFLRERSKKLLFWHIKSICVLRHQYLGTKISRIGTNKTSVPQKSRRKYLKKTYYLNNLYSQSVRPKHCNRFAWQSIWIQIALAKPIAVAFTSSTINCENTEILLFAHNFGERCQTWWRNFSRAMPYLLILLLFPSVMRFAMNIKYVLWFWTNAVTST